MEELLIRIGIAPDLVEALQLGLFGRMLLAALLGGLIGLERELSSKPAGLRTNMLICVGAALFTELSILIAVAHNEQVMAGAIVAPADPGRIAAQIVTGIGFLGAGTILQSRGSIVGLTTAATIWVVAAIGMAAGARAYGVAIVATVLVAVVLGILGRVAESLTWRIGRKRYSIDIDPEPETLRSLEALFTRAGLRIRTTSIERSPGKYKVEYELQGPRRAHGDLPGRLLEHPGVQGGIRIE